MDLKQGILETLELTRNLREALAVMDLPLCGRLLEKRGRAMEKFEQIHKMAAAPERAACRDDLAELKKADRQLQEQSREMLATVAGEFREQLGLPPGGISPTGRNPRQACLDRKV